MVTRFTTVPPTPTRAGRPRARTRNARGRRRGPARAGRRRHVPVRPHADGVAHHAHRRDRAFENHSYASVLGPSAPDSYFKTLASQCGTATHFTATSWPRSLPNYLELTSGTTGGITGGITGDCAPGPGCRSTAPSIFEQVGPSGWRSWDESAPAACAMQDAYPYAARHEPSLYFSRIPMATCQAKAVPMPSVLPQPGRAFTWVVPNMLDDMHDGTLTRAQSWLRHVLNGPQGLLKTNAYALGHTAIFIWFDSAADTDSAATPVPLIVVAPSVGHRVVTMPLTDAHLLHGWEGLLGLPCLADACTVSGFDRAFRI